MDPTSLAITYLGRALIAIIIGAVICFVVSKGHDIYLKYKDKRKEIEVHTDKNSDSNN